MSFEEKGTWVSAITTVLTYAVYAAIVLGRAGGVPLADVSYVSTMVWAIGIAIGLNIVGRIAVAIAKPSEADKTDIRDKEINRRGEYVGNTVAASAMLLPLILAVREAEHFWIANAIYAGFILGGIVGATVKIVAYRRGF